MSEPELSKTNHRSLHTFVNGRAVRDRVINHAIATAYGAELERGRHPVGVIYVHLPAGEVDVNVHPAKAEVRFANRADVHDALVRALRLMLAAAPWIARPARPIYQGTPDATHRPPPVYAPIRTEESRRQYRHLAPAPLPAPPLTTLRSETPHYPGGGHRFPTPEAADGLTPNLRSHGAPGSFGGMTLLGQAQDRTLILEDAGGVHLMAPHSARLALAVARLKVGWASESMVRQPMMMPVQVDLSAPEIALATEHSASLSRLGLSLEPFGGGTWQILALPAPLARGGPIELMRAALAQLKPRVLPGESWLAAIARAAIMPLRGPMTPAAVASMLVALDGANVRAEAPLVLTPRLPRPPTASVIV